MKRKYNPSKVLDRMRDIIEHYGRNRLELTDNEVADMRAGLSVAVYTVVENILEPQYMKVLEASVAFERAEGDVFKRQLIIANGEGWSKSQAIDIARKYSKCDDEYLQVFENLQYEKTYLELVLKMVTQANQIINAMSARKPNLT